MIVIHYVNGYHSRMETSSYPRLITASLVERMDIMPAAALTGARQTGKTTLARDLVPGDRLFLTLDDPGVMEEARRSPASLLSGDQPLTLDEVQRAPDLLHAVKIEADRSREPGRFLLTGSANLLLMRRVSESLAGRASYLTLWPMTRREQRGLGRAGIWDELLAAKDADWLDLVMAQPDDADDWRDLARRGGFPTPALSLGSNRARAVWFEGYARAYLERDLQDAASISALPDFRRVMRTASLRIGQVINQTAIARDAALPQPTVHRYLNLMETTYVIVRVQPYAVNRAKRLIKAPKLYWGDVGLGLHLSQSDPDGPHLENIVLQDLLAWRDARLDHAEALYWRTSSGEEVDFVIETNDSLLPIEVKASNKPGFQDAKHIRSFRREYPEKSRPGLLLHTGDAVEWVAPDVLAAPWRRIL